MRQDPRKLACDELAERLSTPEGLRTARLLELTDILSPPPQTVSNSEPAQESLPTSTNPLPISIWHPVALKLTDSEEARPQFQRPQPPPLGDHHARRSVIEARKPSGTRRVCLFGESVAAGYLLAPHFTPAEELERRLCQMNGDTDFEVVDLARTNETLGPMVTTLERSLQLRPDLWVIFGGNNWNLLETPAISPYVPSVRGRQLYGLALRRSGLAGPRRLARQQLRQKVDQAFNTIAELAKRQDIPVIIVVPEVNLADWEDRQPVPWLPGDGCRRWYEIYSQALRQLADGQFAETLRLADELLALDDGLCSTTHRLRVRALAADNRLVEARAAGEAEVEAGRYATQAFLSAPRISVSEQDLLRSQATRHGFASVDLPNLFAGVTGSPLPGRRLFLDYCHLTVEGVEVAMQAVADKVFGLCPPATRRAPLTRSRISPTGPRDSPIGPSVSPAASALAKLGAALHSAHRLLTVGDRHSTLLGWCREALADDPDIAATMLHLLIARCSPAPAVLTTVQQHQLATPHPLLLQHGWHWDYLDVDIIAAICETLEETTAKPSSDDPTHPSSCREQVQELLLEYHNVGPDGVELTRPPYLWQPLERFYPEAMATRGMTGRAFYRSPWPTSSFCLITDATTAIELSLTCRLPTITEAATYCGELQLRINGLDVGSHSLEQSWKSKDFVIPPTAMDPGLNQLTLIWPPLPKVGDLALDNSILRLENGLEADLHPVFGELFSLRARRR